MVLPHTNAKKNIVKLPKQSFSEGFPTPFFRLPTSWILQIPPNYLGLTKNALPGIASLISSPLLPWA